MYRITVTPDEQWIERGGIGHFTITLDLPQPSGYYGLVTFSCGDYHTLRTYTGHETFWVTQQYNAYDTRDTYDCYAFAAYTDPDTYSNHVTVHVLPSVPEPPPPPADGGPPASDPTPGDGTPKNPPPVGPPPPSLPPAATTCGSGQDPAAIPNPFSSAPVRYFDGVINYQMADLNSAGFGASWGQSRSWSNRPGYAGDSLYGFGTVDAGMPHLADVGGGTVALVSNGTTARFFDPAGGAYQERFYGKDTLTYDATAGEYTLTDLSGRRLRFDDFAALPAAQRGQLLGVTDADGHVTTVTRAADGTVSEVQRSDTIGGTTVTESYLYAYVAAGDPNAGRLASVVLRRRVNAGAWATVREADYAYYDGVEAHGNLGDLKTAVVRDAAGTALDTSYYRYYVTGEANGYAHGLKYALHPHSYARLAAAVADPLAATDAQLALYADNYFEYDSTQRVTKEVAQGEGCSVCSAGLGTYTFAYTVSGNAASVNKWKVKTVETLPDGNQNVVYTNAYGEVMLKVFKEVSTGREWATFHQYDLQGREVLRAEPSAVSGYSEAYADLLHWTGTGYEFLRDTQGLITRYVYASTTTATETAPGDVAGLLQYTAVQRGETTTASLQQLTRYFQHTAGGATVWPVAMSTAFRNPSAASPGGRQPQTTSSAYTWYSGTTQVQSQTVTAPAATASQNGPDAPAVTTTFFDGYGRPVWTRDADDFLSYTEYDPATGAAVKTITDVDTAQTADFTGLPAGWSTPAGGGLHLKTQMLVDSLGRATKVTAPNGTVRYTVHNDPSHEVRSYAWDPAANQPVGPVAVEREDRAREYSESLTFTVPAGYTWGTAPDGTEPIGTVQSLTRRIVNDAGQVVATDQYFDLTGVSYTQTSATLGTAWSPATPTAGNYYRTEFAYDDRGRLKRELSPAGTITRTVSDGLGRVVSTWVGTDDVPTSGYWSPDNTAGTDLVKVSANEYDGGGVGDGNLTQTTEYPGAGASPRVTQFSYDWRDRMVATAVASNDLPPVPQPLAAGFEAPAVGTGSGAYQYNPSGTPWTYSSLSGVAGNGSGFTFTNPPAPEGSQVAFLQTTGTISQSVTLAAGTYALTFQAAQRASYQSSAQTFRVLVDGTAVGTFTPAGTAYADRATANFTVTAGAHTILFQGLNPNGGDNTALLDQVRILARDGGHRPITYYDYDNLGEVVSAERYDGDDVTVADGNGDGVPDRPAPELLRARATTDYDEQGRAYRTSTFSVDSATGAASANALTTNAWYDRRGDVIKTAAPGGLVTKAQYDGAGRVVATFTTDGGGDATYADATTVTGDVVLDQTETQYDGDGNALLTTTRQRNHDASGTGDLRTAGNAARFVQADAATRGSWQGAYGQDGYALAQGASGLPPYAQVSWSGQWNYTWAASTSDGRALQKPGASDRLAACWYSAGSYTVDVNLTDGQAHQVALYLLDWDNIGRSERVDVLDAETGKVLDSRTVSSFGGGVYEVWGLRGHVQLRLTNLGGPSSNAVASGLFFDATSTPPAPPARVSYAAAYYDTADRPTAAVDVGTNAGAAWTRPGAVPARSDTILVTSTAYDDAGRAFRVTDPRGLEGRTYYDLLGRSTKAVENYVDGTVSDTDDKTTEYSYFGPGLLRTLTGDLTGGGSQTTQYVYGVSPADGSALTSNDLVREVRHPDKGTGAASASEHDLFSYDALGETITATDRNGTVHAYRFDVAGRPTADAVTTLGAGVDGAVRRLETAYDSAGRAYLFTSSDAASGGNVVNQVQRQFNGLGQIVKEYQAHGGAVDPATTPNVQSTYSEMAGGANHSRLTSLVYPDGFTVNYQYAAGVDDGISRLTGLANGATTLESYSYLGLGTVVTRAHPQSGVDLTYLKQAGEPDGDAGDQYSGLDRFGRVADQRWINAAGTDLDRYRYGYDRDANRLYNQDLLNGTLGELYSYDGLNQLSSFQRGTLNAAKDGLVGAASRSQSWTPDVLGNFEGVTTDGTPQARTHNQQNQVTAVGASALTYDADGNLTTDEAGHALTWDAWSRPVAVGTQTYAYDALFRRVKEGAKDLYYSADWQVLEERQAGAPVARYVWSPVYVDALVLRDRDADGTLDNGLEERLYALQDVNYNTTALVNTAGTVVERNGYDPFGAVTVRDGNGNVRPGGSAYAWQYDFQGYRRDPADGYDYARFRLYSPSLGRFVSTDWIGFASGDPNLYRFEGNSPANRTDPSGLWWYPGKYAIQYVREWVRSNELDAQLQQRLDSKPLDLERIANPDTPLNGGPGSSTTAGSARTHSFDPSFNARIRQVRENVERAEEAAELTAEVVNRIAIAASITRAGVAGGIL
jgi:RHS repeat-associated protein